MPITATNTTAPASATTPANLPVSTSTNSSKVARSHSVELKNPRLTLPGVIRSEWIKALSLRSIRWTIATSIVLGIGMSLVMGFAIRDLAGSLLQEGFIEYLLTVTGFPATFLSLVFGVLGVFVFSNEYASGMILSTLTAAPRRGMVMTAKAIVLTAISALVALVVVAGAAVIALVLVPGVDGVLMETQALTGMLGTILFLVAVSLLSFAIAGIVRSTAGAITIVVGILLLVPMILQIVSGLVDWSWVVTVQNYLPMTLGSTLGNGLTDPGMVSLRVEMEQAGTGYGAVPGYWEAAAALAAWVVIPMLAAVKLFFARDAK
ncbi:hypothetical protein VR010_04070 [Actinomycetaceae bacterium L2_0104]